MRCRERPKNYYQHFGQLLFLLEALMTLFYKESLKLISEGAGGNELKNYIGF